MQDFYVIKRSARYAVKTLRSEEKAREYAASCNKANRTHSEYFVATYKEGRLVEI